MARASVRRRNGPKPDRAAFSDFTAPKYPPAFTRAVGIGLLIVALASGWISAVRLYQAGYDNAPITLRHVDGRVAKCGPYPASGIPATAGAIREGQCIQDFQRQGYERVAE